MLKTALTTAFLLGASVVAQAQDDNKVTYADHVQPIFRAKCFACHNSDKKSGGLDLTNFTSLMQGGSSGQVIDGGDGDASRLYAVVSHQAQPYMPPNSDKLPADMLAVIKKWIDGGALDTKASSPIIKKKAKMELSLSFAPNGRPEGPAPMPQRLALQPTKVTEATTAVSALATNPWSPLVAVSGQRQVLLYNTQTLQLAGVLPFPEGIARSMKFSRSGQLLLAGGGRGADVGKVVVWNIKTGDRVIEVGDELDEVLGADMSADQKYIALGGPSRMVRVYSTATGQKLYEMKKHTDWVTAVSFSPDGVLFATGDRNGGVFVWEAETGREYLGLRGHTAAITGFAWRKDSNLLASASEDTTVRTWELENGNQLKAWGAHGAGTSSIYFSREDQIVTVGRDRTAKLWNQDGAAVRTFEAFNDLALQVAFCDETKRVIAGDFTGVVRVWNAADGARVGELSTNPPTLEARLAAANAEVARVQGVQKQANDGYVAADAAYKAFAANLDANQKKVAELTQQEATATTKLNEAKAVVVDATAKANAANAVVAALTPVVPGLKNAVAQATDSATKAPADAEITAVLNQLKTIATARETALTTNMKVATDEAARLKAAQEAAAANEKLIADYKVGIDATKKQVEALTAALPAEQQKVAVAKTALDQANAALGGAQGEVNRWTAEIAFAAKLNAFRTKEAEVNQLVATADQAAADLQKMQQEAAAAAGEVTKAQQTEAAATAAVNEAKQKLATVTAQRDALMKTVTDTEAALAMLKEAGEKAAAVAKLMPNDKELATAAEQLKASLDRNTKIVADGKAQLANYVNDIAAATAAVAAVEPKLVEAKTLVAKANEMVAAKQAAMKPVADKATAAKAAADQARAALTPAQQEIDAFRAPKA